MRTAVSIICFLMVTAFTLRAQQKGDKVEALRVAFITKHVALSADEGNRFWPVYNEYHDKLRTVRRSLRQTHRQYSETMSEEDVKSLAAREMELRKVETEIHQVYSARIAGIIGHRKYMRLRLAEEQFRREMLKVLRDRDEDDK